MDSAKKKRTQRALRGKAEAQRASELALDEREKNRLLLEANEHFLQTGIHIKDIYGVLQN